MIRAVVFDLDGVLADTERLQCAAYQTVLRELDVDVDIEEYRRQWIATGFGPEYACRTYRLPIGPDELRARKAAVYVDLLRRGVQAIPGAPGAVARLRATHRIGLATNTVRAETRMILGQLGLTPYFDALVTREDYAAPKPAPDAYLAAARALGVAPAECAVVEDTTRGVRAAVAAGMKAIAAPNELTFDNDFTGASRRIEHLDELTPALLAAL
ncbi:MAG TPA: HAD family phosphatase [Candidatus Binatia bacterium]|nr:HAD family phosphatase [Candidatus Binatia bacterium]